MESELRSRVRATSARLAASAVGRAVEGPRRALTRLLAPLRRHVEAVTGWPARRRARRRSGAAYDDGRVRVTDDALVLRRYHWPAGRRTIAWAEVAAVDEWPVTGVGSYRVQGPGLHRRWYHRDPARRERGWGLVVHLASGRHVVVTPDDPGAVRQLLVDRVT